MWGRRLRLSVQSIETWHAFITYLIFGILYPFQLTTKTAINFNCESGTLLWEVARVLVYTSIYWNHKRLRPVIYSNRNSCCVCCLPAVRWHYSEEKEKLQYTWVKVNITKEHSHALPLSRVIISIKISIQKFNIQFQTALTFVDDYFLLCLITKGSVLLYNTHHSWNCVIYKALILAS